MKTLKEDSKIEAQGKLDERIHFASYMPARTKWMSALGDLCQLGDQLREEQAEELRRYLERLLEAAEDYAAWRYVRGYHVGAASVLQEHGLPGAEEHAQLVPGLEGLGEALQQLKQSLPSAPAADAVCTAPVLESMVQGGLEVDPAIPTTLGTEYLLQQINQHESKLQEALDEKGRKRLRELESLLSQRLYDYVEDRFLWGYRIGVRTILECKD